MENHGNPQPPTEQGDLFSNTPGASGEHDGARPKTDQTNMLEDIINAIPDGFILIDGAGVISDCNDAARQMFGADHGSVLPEDTILQLFSKDNEICTQIESWLENRTQAESETIADSSLTFEARSDSIRRDLYITITQLKTRDNAYIVVLRDITRLQDLSRFKTEMLRIASHDLRSPLNLIVGYADMIAMDVEDPDSPILKYTKVILDSTRRMNTLLEDMLRTEQIRSTPLELHENVDLNNLIKIVCVNARPEATKKDISLDSQINIEDGVSILADRVLLRQAMENLISNALKYTPAGGRVSILASAGDGRFDFIVEDTGIGIPRDSLGKVFNAFYRVKQEGIETTKGSGLGLSLVKDVIERHGGDVWVNSEEKKGSQFGFWLPLTTKSVKSDG